MVKLPPRVVAGDTVAIVSPSWGALGRWPHRLARGTAYLESLGLKVKVMPNATKSNRWVAGTPQERADDLNAAFADPDVGLVLAAIGGNHSNQVAPLLDYDLIAEHPKPFVGYSDNTVLHWAVHQRTGLVTFYGPSPVLALAEDGAGEGLHVMEYTDRYFRAALNGRRRPRIRRSTRVDGGVPRLRQEGRCGTARQVEPNPGWVVLREGEARGQLLGGCLETIAWHLKGSEWWLDLEGAVLFLETSEEAPSPAHVDGYLTDFEQLGVFDAVTGLVVGRAAYFAHDDVEILHTVFHERTQQAGIPVLANFDCGHTDPMATLPLGAEVHLDTDVGTFTTLAAPTSHASAPSNNVCEVLASEKQVSQGRREGTYPEGTCPTENAARRSLFAARIPNVLLGGALRLGLSVERQHEPEDREQTCEDRRDERGPRAPDYDIGDHEHRAHHSGGEEKETSERQSVRDFEHALLVALTELDAVIGGRGNQQRRRRGGA